MADPGQLARLKSDVKAWNQWRLDHPGERIDLEGAELSDAYCGRRISPGLRLQERTCQRATS